MYITSTTDEQRSLLQKQAIESPEDLFQATRAYVEEHFTGDNPHKRGLYKRHILLFLRRTCNSPFVDFHKMRVDGLVVFCGAYPDQWLYFYPQRELPPPLELPPPVVDYNLDMDEDAALAAAVEASLLLDARTRVPTVDEISCPITLDVFDDPVLISTGRTFERHVIEDWFCKSATDPLTGEAVVSTAVRVDEVMKERIARYRGRGRGRGGRGGRGFARG